MENLVRTFVIRFLNAADELITELCGEATVSERGTITAHVQDWGSYIGSGMSNVSVEEAARNAIHGLVQIRGKEIENIEIKVAHHALPSGMLYHCDFCDLVSLECKKTGIRKYNSYYGYTEIWEADCGDFTVVDTVR